MTVRSFGWYTLAWGGTLMIAAVAHACTILHHPFAGMLLTSVAIYAGACIGQKWRRAYPEKGNVNDR